MTSASKERRLLQLSLGYLEDKLNGRSALEKPLFDNGRMMYVALVGVTGIWAVELVANISSGEGWAAYAHLIIVGPLECLMLYALYVAGRGLYWRCRIRALECRLRKTAFR